MVALRNMQWPEAEQAIAELRGRLGNEWDPYLRKL